jgi:hypothetical protein
MLSSLHADHRVVQRLADATAANLELVQSIEILKEVRLISLYLPSRHIVSQVSWLCYILSRRFIYMLCAHAHTHAMIICQS